VHAVTEITDQTGVVEAYTYDRNGNMESGGGLVIGWTADDRPRRITNISSGVTTTYAYDSHGQRVLKKVGNDTTLYYGPLVELSSRGSLIKYYYANDKLVARHETGSGLIVYHKDYLGFLRPTVS
jgi:YD repeat-containing protein